MSFIDVTSRKSCALIMGSDPFHLRQIQLIAGEAVDGGEEEFVVAEFAGDAVQEGELGFTVVAGAAVKGDGFLGVVLVVPAAANLFGGNSGPVIDVFLEVKSSPPRFRQSAARGPRSEAVEWVLAVRQGSISALGAPRMPA